MPHQGAITIWRSTAARSMSPRMTSAAEMKSAAGAAAPRCQAKVVARLSIALRQEAGGAVEHTDEKVEENVDVATCNGQPVCRPRSPRIPMSTSKRRSKLSRWPRPNGRGERVFNQYERRASWATLGSPATPLRMARSAPRRRGPLRLLLIENLKDVEEHGLVLGRGAESEELLGRRPAGSPLSRSPAGSSSVTERDRRHLGGKGRVWTPALIPWRC